MAVEVQNIDAMVANATGKSRKVKIQKLPSVMKKVSKENQVHIYNVGPWALTRELGSIGSFRIPACPEDKEYVERDPIPGVFEEPIPGEHPDFMEVRTEDGRYIAEQILGIGPFMAKRDSFEHMGVFIGSEVGPNAKPTKAELSAAKAKLSAYLEELVNDARKAYERGDLREIVDRHRLAARYLKLEQEVWYTTRTAKARQECPSCGTALNTNVKICSSCHYVIDKEWFEKNKANFAK